MTLDAPYIETDTASAHYAHTIQPLEEGAWKCLTCAEEEDA